VFSAVIPQVAALFGYFGAGGKYWHELVGLTLDLQSTRCLPAVRGLANHLGSISALSARLGSMYESTYHRSVHVGWTEHKHYKTDDDGHRKYTHSTWSKNHRTLWVEPSGLDGTHCVVGGWDHGDRMRNAKGIRLRDERIFNLLEADRENPEKDFHLDKHHVGFGRDAAISALSAAFMALPAAFYDDITGALAGADNPLPPRRQRFSHQKHTLLLAGAITGALVATRYRRRHAAMMHENKYELGQEVETQIERVPDLSLTAAWIEFFGSPDLDGLPHQISGRDPDVRRISSHADDFSYTYGSGWDNGRRLDSIYIDSAGVRSLFSAAAGHFPHLATDLQRYLAPPAVRAKLLRALRNAVGTDVLEAQIDADEDEAKGGSFGRSLRFVYPIWGMMVLDAILKLTNPLR
jgi:hypothetical protein